MALESVKLIHFLTKLKCFCGACGWLVTPLGPLSSPSKLDGSIRPLIDCLFLLSPSLTDTVNLNQFQTLITITNPFPLSICYSAIRIHYLDWFGNTSLEEALLLSPMVKWLMTGPYSQPKRKKSYSHRRKRQITHSKNKRPSTIPKR